MLVKCILFLFCNQLLIGGAVRKFTPAIYPAILSSSQCGQYNPTQDEDLMTALKKIVEQLPVKPMHGASCQSIHSLYPSAPSGYYNITTANVQVYCDMEGTNCGGVGGWTRVAYVNMTQTGATCPTGLEQMSFNGSSYCGRFSPGSGCVSALLNTTISYQQVCGRVAGYQEGAPDAAINNAANINQVYFDGLSIHVGNPRNHIWTYMAGFFASSHEIFNCPCNTGNTLQVPSYVGNDYYCESGNDVDPAGSPCRNFVYTVDVLWDGQQCTTVEAPCCTHPSMPWFIKTLSKNTTDNIELRACTTNTGCPGTVPVFLIELYVR